VGGASLNPHQKIVFVGGGGGGGGGRSIHFLSGKGQCHRNERLFGNKAMLLCSRQSYMIKWFVFRMRHKSELSFCLYLHKATTPKREGMAFSAW
jgi:hypothetical protein